MTKIYSLIEWTEDSRATNEKLFMSFHGIAEYLNMIGSDGKIKVRDMVYDVTEKSLRTIFNKAKEISPCQAADFTYSCKMACFDFSRKYTIGEVSVLD